MSIIGRSLRLILSRGSFLNCRIRRPLTRWLSDFTAGSTKLFAENRPAANDKQRVMPRTIGRSCPISILLPVLFDFVAFGQQQITSTDRITGPVDETVISRGGVHPLAKAELDVGRTLPDERME